MGSQICAEKRDRTKNSDDDFPTDFSRQSSEYSEEFVKPEYGRARGRFQTAESLASTQAGMRDGEYTPDSIQSVKARKARKRFDTMLSEGDFFDMEINEKCYTTSTPKSRSEPFLSTPSLSCCDPDVKLFRSAAKNTELHRPMILRSQDALAKVIEMNSSDLPKGFEKIFEEKDEEHKLKIYLSSYTTPEKHRINKVRAEFYVPATPEQFEKFMSDVSERWAFDDGTLETLYPITALKDENEETHTVYYLSHKKQMIASARDFVYIKTVKKLDEDNYADSSVSIDYPDFAPTNSHARCELKVEGHLVKLVSSKGEKPLSLVKLFSESDFKINMPVFMAKKLTQVNVQSSVDRCIQRLKELYPSNTSAK